MSRTALSIVVSLALHGAIGLATLALVPGHSVSPDLVFDLTMANEMETPRSASSAGPAAAASSPGPSVPPRGARAAAPPGATASVARERSGPPPREAPARDTAARAAPTRTAPPAPPAVSEPPPSASPWTTEPSSTANEVVPAPIDPPGQPARAVPDATSAAVAREPAAAPAPPAISAPERATGALGSASVGGERGASGSATGSGSALARVGAGAGAGAPGATGGGGSAAGSSTGGGQTAAVPGLRDDLGAEYAPYLAGLRHRIQSSLRYPRAARRRGLEGTVHVEVVITAAGAVGTVAIVRSSSHALLDEAAIEAVRRVPAQPFPRDLPPRTLRVRVPVVFQLQ